MAEDLRAVDPTATTVPANIYGTVAGADSTARLAVAINGTIEGVGKSFFNEQWRFTIMVDPAHFIEGENTIEIYEVTDAGLLPISLN